MSALHKALLVLTTSSLLQVLPGSSPPQSDTSAVKRARHTSNLTCASMVLGIIYVRRARFSMLAS